MMERAIDSMAAEAAERRNLRPLRVFSDLEHEREEWRTWPTYEQLTLTIPTQDS